MRRTSPETTVLIERLFEPLILREKIMGSRDYATLLSKIAEANEPAAIVYLVPFILSSNRNVAHTAAKAIHKLLLATPLTDLPWLDENLRPHSAYPGDHLEEWRKLSPLQLHSLQSFGDTSTSLFALVTFHRNGYVRQAAIEKLSLVTTGAELPFLILRLNDWVTNVRDAAYQAVRSRLRAEYCQRFVENFPLLARLEHAERADHKQILDEISQLLLSNDCRAVLLQSFQSGDHLIRRRSFKLALNLESPDLDHVVNLALAQNDTVIRLWAAQRVSSAFAGATLERFLDAIRRDRSMQVRREALRTAVRLSLPGFVEELRAGLLDSHASMREESRYYLQKIQPLDIAAYYREHLSTAEAHILPAAISGLGETGRGEDAGLIVSYTSHAMGHVRRAAIKALAMLDPESYLEIFVKALEDPVSRVSRQALKALSSKTSRLSAARIWELFQSATHDHVKRHTFSLLAKFSKWESISYIVRAVCDADEKIVAIAHVEIQRWFIRFNRSFSTATPEQLGKLRESLEECGHLIDEATREQLRFLVK